MFFLWIIVGIFLISLLSFALLFMSTLKIEIQNFHYILPKNNLSDNDFKVIVKLYLFGKIKIFSITIDKAKIEKKIMKKNFTKLEEKWKKKNIDFKFFDVIRYLIEIIIWEKIKLQIYIGIEDAALTAISVGAISGLIGILFTWIQNDNNRQKMEFNVLPIYQNTNLLKIYFDGIFAIKIRDNIKMIYKLFNKGRVNKDGRTSNRGAYAYCNE